jgi:hypothetical protein
VSKPRLFGFRSAEFSSMIDTMPRSVQLPTPRPSIESLLKQLRIPKARQKQLRAMMDEARAERTAENPAASTRSNEQSESLDHASPAH